MVTMTLDHIGIFLYNPNFFSQTSFLYQLGFIFRIIGRIACPLYCFMLVEGALHTKSWKRYLLRLLIILFPILIAQIVLDYGFHAKVDAGNIFIDLSLGLLMIVAFENKKKSIKLLGILPILYWILSFVCYAIEYQSLGKITITWFPYFIRCQYYFLSIILMLAIYLCCKFLPKLYSFLGYNSELYKDETNYRFYQNCMVVIVIVLFVVLSYVLKFMNIEFFNVDIQSYMLLAILPLLFYNGRRGYNAPWFKYGSYLYYPVHFIIIALVFLI